MALLIVDNYDSFTYNLVHLIEPLMQVEVVRNDALDLDEVANYSHIVLSPGPGLPAESGMMPELISRYFHKKPILGVCLGMQALAIHSGADIYNQQKVKHGVSRELEVDKDSLYLFRNLPKKIEVGLYHSWAVDKQTLSDEWICSAHTSEGVLMAMEHCELPVAGVQFHPESIMTPSGKMIIKNWLERSMNP